MIFQVPSQQQPWGSRSAARHGWHGHCFATAAAAGPTTKNPGGVEGFDCKDRGQLGSRDIYVYIYMYIYQKYPKMAIFTRSQSPFRSNHFGYSWWGLMGCPFWTLGFNSRLNSIGPGFFQRGPLSKKSAAKSRSFVSHDHPRGFALGFLLFGVFPFLEDHPS